MELHKIILANLRVRTISGSFLWLVCGFTVGLWLKSLEHPTAHYHIDFQDLTTDRYDDQTLLMVVLILSAPNNFDLRDTIRNSWLRLNPNHNVIRHVFAIGTEGMAEVALEELHGEHTRQNDLLLLPIYDSYANLTLKLKESLLHLHSSMASKYVLKLDDDSFARLDVIVEELEKRELAGYSSYIRQKCYYWGFFAGDRKVHRAGKWKEMEYSLSPWYLPYAIGGGYLISKPCVDFIVQNRQVLQGYVSEDVTVGTWLSVLSAERRHDVRFDTEWLSRGCRNHFLVQHRKNRAQMIQRYKSLITHRRLCPSEFQHIKSYEYNWTALPFDCCKRNLDI